MDIIFEPTRKYNVGLHKQKSPKSGFVYTYACTRMIVRVDGIKVFRHVHWGFVDEETDVFYPNNNYISLPIKCKKQLIFPEYIKCCGEFDKGCYVHIQKPTEPTPADYYEEEYAGSKKETSPRKSFKIARKLGK